MSSDWVDFKVVKESVSMEMVLARYNVRVRKVNQMYVRGKCPLPSHISKESGDSFGVHTGKNAWACQSNSCVKARRGRKGGNVLDFVAAMENCTIREAAAKLANWFSVGSPPPEANENRGERLQLVSEGEGKGREVPNFNRPLEFALKDVNPTHEYIVSRGITRETASLFGAGFFPGKGMMAGRVVIPVRDREGRVVAYAGRSIDGSEPKYKMPGGFYKTLELFNQHHATGADCVIVVEGFFDCMKVHQAGYTSVVALMGSFMSERQEEILAAFPKVVLMLDGDEPGREAAKEIASRLVNHTFIKVVNLPLGRQPDQLSSDELKAILGTL